jgi:Tfp pilus assembly protein PilF
VRRNPGFAEGHNDLGLVLMQGRDPRAAEAEFREAVRMKQGYAEAHYNLALALQQQGKDSEAQSEREKAFALEPALRTAPQ